jgi:hypothetical protein
MSPSELGLTMSADAEVAQASWKLARGGGHLPLSARRSASSDGRPAARIFAWAVSMSYSRLRIEIVCA